MGICSELEPIQGNYILVVQWMPLNRETDTREIRLIGTTDGKQIFYIEKSSVNWFMTSVNRDKFSRLTEEYS